MTEEKIQALAKALDGLIDEIPEQLQVEALLFMNTVAVTAAKYSGQVLNDIFESSDENSVSH
jgi:hypothetical protein